MDENQQIPSVIPPKLSGPYGKVFFGHHKHSLDGKGRIIVPNAFRELLGQKFTISLTPAADGMALYPEEVFDARLEEIFEIYSRDPYNESVLAYMDYMGKMTTRGVEVDVQGRILVSPIIRERIFKNEKELEITGAFNHVRIVAAQNGAENDTAFEENRKTHVSNMSAARAEYMAAQKGE